MKRNIFISLVLCVMILSVSGCTNKKIIEEEKEKNTQQMTEIKHQVQNNIDNDTVSKNNPSKSLESISDKQDDIGIAQAIYLIEERYGKNGNIDKNTKNIIQYEAIDIQTIDTKDYYNFEYQWLNPETKEISVLGHIFVETNGNDIYFVEDIDDTWNFYESETNVIAFGCETENHDVATLIISDDNSFQFMSEYGIYNGIYTKTEKQVICTTLDEKFIITFNIINESTLEILLEESVVSNEIYEKFPTETRFYSSL